MKKVLLFAFALSFSCAMFAAADSSDTKLTGWVSESKCAQKGASAAHEDCTKKCIEMGAKPVVVSDADQKVYAVDNPEALKGHEGHHVTVQAKVDNEKNSIHIDDVQMAKVEGSKSDGGASTEH
jgi:hypothetical protein